MYSVDMQHICNGVPKLWKYVAFQTTANYTLKLNQSFSSLYKNH
jgi:hypothetical protein